MSPSCQPANIHDSGLPALSPEIVETPTAASLRSVTLILETAGSGAFRLSSLPPRERPNDPTVRAASVI